MIKSVNSALLDANDQLIAKAKFEGNNGQNAVFTLAPGSKPEEFKRDTTLNIRIFDTVNGLETYKGIVDRVENNTLYVSKYRVESFVERRDDVKVIVNKPTFMIAKNDTNGKLQKHSVILRDISAGGVCIITDQDMKFEKEYEIVFGLGRDNDVLTISLVRKTIGAEGKFECGCRFVNLHPAQESQVREFVFKKLIGLSK